MSAARRFWSPGPVRGSPDRPPRYVPRALFFDLVFVVVIAQLAQRLTAHPSWSGVGWFVFLFCAVWSSWINGTLYYDLHGTNDVSLRLFTFFQVLAVAVMAVFVRDVPATAHGFALGFAANTVVLVVNAHRDGPLLGVPIAAGLTVWVVHLDALELDEQRSPASAVAIEP